jgi:hypothetical protein
VGFHFRQRQSDFLNLDGSVEPAVQTETIAREQLHRVVHAPGRRFD